jgi:hypothetical protein
MDKITKENLKQSLFHLKKGRESIISAGGALPKDHHYEQEIADVVYVLNTTIDVMSGHLTDLEK